MLIQLIWQCNIARILLQCHADHCLTLHGCSVDLPDPVNHLVSNLYTVDFYRAVLKVLRPATGLLTTQATSIQVNAKAYWCIFDSLKAAVTENAAAYEHSESAVGADTGIHRDGDNDDGALVRPYKVPMAQSGWLEWGFVIASAGGLLLPTPAISGGDWTLSKDLELSFLTQPMLQSLFVLALDQRPPQDAITGRRIRRINKQGTGLAFRLFYDNSTDRELADD